MGEKYSSRIGVDIGWWVRREEELLKIISFFSSAIKSGEPWTDKCEESMKVAFPPKPIE